MLASRALAELGVAVVLGERLSGAAAAAEVQADPSAQSAAQAPVDIVQVVRGREPYVVDSNGVQYPDGAMIPGHGKLVGIGSTIYVQGPNGEIKKIRPVTAAELAARAAAANFDSVVGSPQATPVASTNAQLSADETDSEPKSKAVKKQ